MKSIYSVTVIHPDDSTVTHTVVSQPDNVHNKSAETVAIDKAVSVEPAGSEGLSAALVNTVDLDGSGGILPYKLYSCVSQPVNAPTITRNILGSVHGGNSAIDNAISTGLTDAGAGSTGVSATRLLTGIDLDATT